MVCSLGWEEFMKGALLEWINGNRVRTAVGSLILA